MVWVQHYLGHFLLHNKEEGLFDFRLPHKLNLIVNDSVNFNVMLARAMVEHNLQSSQLSHITQTQEQEL